MLTPGGCSSLSPAGHNHRTLRARPLPMLATFKVRLTTLPPLSIVSAPVPKLPIFSPPLGPLVQLEAGPITVTVPFEPAVSPTEPPPLLTAPPS